MTRAQVEAATNAAVVLLVLALSGALVAAPSWPVAVAVLAVLGFAAYLRSLAYREEDQRIDEALAAADTATGIAHHALDEVAEVKKTAGRAYEAATQPRRAGPPSY